MVTTIYALVDPVTWEPRYVGKTTKPLAFRLAGHLRGVQKGEQTYKARWMRTLPAPPTIQALAVDVGDRASGCAVERVVIAVLRETGRRLTNLTDGGEGFIGGKHTPETRARIREAHLGKDLSPEHCANIAAAQRGKKKNYTPEVAERRAAKISATMRGRQKSPEHQEKITAALKGRVMPAEWRAHQAAAHRGKKYGPCPLERRERIAATNRGQKRSSETCARISAAKRMISIETRAKMSAAKLGMRWSPESIAKRSATVRRLHAA